jgi:glycosyltransferase involved in cell wall biosynthesis
MADNSISIIIPNYNHSHYITNQLDVLVNQDVTPLEVVVIDDASTDDSVAVIGRYASRYPVVRLLRNERNMGVVATLNRGLREARGEYLYAGAADDLVAPGFVACVRRLIARYPDAGVYFGMYRAIDAEGRELCVERSSRWQTESHVTPERFLNEFLEAEPPTYSPSPATVYRKQYIEELGGFRPELGHWCDTFLIRAIGLKYGAVYVPQVLASMRRLEAAYSQTQSRNIRLMLDIAARAAWLMRSPQCRDRFPEAHVARWEERYRHDVIWGYLWSQHESIVRAHTNLPLADPAAGTGGRGPGWLRRPYRFWARLVFAYHWRRLQAYTPDISCYAGTNGTT